MFHPVDHPMERGWVGRVDGDRVVHLAAQTLQSFFTGGGASREHAVYSLAETCLLAPVLHPPAVRVFDDQLSFAFANPAAIAGPRAEIQAAKAPLTLLPRLAAVVGRDGRIEGFTGFAEWRRPDAASQKDRDFGLGLGPLVVTPDELDPSAVDVLVRVDGDERLRGSAPGFDWASARDLAEDGTVLRPGDLLAGPAFGAVEEIASGARVELELQGIGTLDQAVA